MYKRKYINALVKKYNAKNRHQLTTIDFINHAKRYIKAVSEQRMICSIGSVSSSGMSRTMKFLEMPKNGGYLLNFFTFFELTEHQQVKNSDYFRIHGCGMDMVFNTNYNNIMTLKYMGLITKKRAVKLAQQTPQVV